MILALVLSMCGSPPFAVTPKPGDVPPHAVLWATGKVPFTVEDGEGHALPFSTIDHGDVVEVSLDLPEGKQFYVRELTEGRRLSFRAQGKPIGPWKVTRRLPVKAPPAPSLSIEEAAVSDGCPSLKLWELSSDTPAPIYEMELSGASVSRIAWSPVLSVGHSCGSNWNWSDGSVNLRVRAHFVDGSMTPWSDAIELDEPTEPLWQRLYIGVLKLL